MKLIIAEKPSLARNIIAGIDGKMDKKNGYYIGSEYIVTWAFGHLFSLSDVESYTGETGGRWTLDKLPCFPEQFKFELRRDAKGTVDSGVKRQFEIIRELCNRPDVDTVINAGDADREGEIIVRLCVLYALKEKKRELRLWLPDQTPETVRDALKTMREESEYDTLASEGFARTYIDWLYGVNLTRYATISSGGRLLRVGRVIAPIVRAIYDRDMEIRNFKPEKYFVIQSKEETNGEKIELVSKQKFTKDEENEANSAAAAYNAAGAVVTHVKSGKENIYPGKLYSLSTLQNVLGEKYKMSMTDSLKIIQKLYEEGYLTYPRTNSEYLATAEKDKVKAILSNISKLGYPVKFRDSKHVFDDSKIEAHSALTPTYKIPPREKLSPDEAKVYSTVFRRFVAVFCAEECVAEKSEIKILVGDEEFVLKGTVILEPGWTRYDDYNKKDKILPRLSVGDAVNINFLVAERQTTPPKHYTITTLNNYLKNPFKDDKARAKELEESGEVDDAEDYKAIFEGLELGTEATRSGIIDNAKRSGYIELKKDVYTILPGGEYFIESLARLGISMDKYKTSELGKALKRVYRGESTVEEAVGLAEAEIAEVFKNAPRPVIVTGVDTGKYGDDVGECPICHGRVLRGRFNYGCTGEGCKLRVGINICRRDIPIDEVRRLISEGSTSELDGFVSKTGKPFSASLVLKDGAAVFSFAKK